MTHVVRRVGTNKKRNAHAALSKKSYLGAIILLSNVLCVLAGSQREWCGWLYQPSSFTTCGFLSWTSSNTPYKLQDVVSLLGTVAMTEQHTTTTETFLHQPMLTLDFFKSRGPQPSSDTTTPARARLVRCQAATAWAETRAKCARDAQITRRFTGWCNRSTKVSVTRADEGSSARQKKFWVLAFLLGVGVALP